MKFVSESLDHGCVPNVTQQTLFWSAEAIDPRGKTRQIIIRGAATDCKQPFAPHKFGPMGQTSARNCRRRIAVALPQNLMYI